MASPVSRTLRVIDGGAAPARTAVAEVPLTFDAAFRAHAGFVARVALRVLGRPSEVDDLVQDVFLRVLPRLGDLREAAALRGWLAVITARLARRRLRSRRWQIWLGRGRRPRLHPARRQRRVPPGARAARRAVPRARPAARPPAAGLDTAPRRGAGARRGRPGL